VSYAADPADAGHQAGVYAGRILKGEKPENLAVQQTTKVELVFNLKAATSLGLTVPLPLIGRADAVIDRERSVAAELESVIGPSRRFERRAGKSEVRARPEVVGSGSNQRF
jgi:ABC transporter substrate binding protein